MTGHIFESEVFILSSRFAKHKQHHIEYFSQQVYPCFENRKQLLGIARFLPTVWAFMRQWFHTNDTKKDLLSSPAFPNKLDL